MRQSRKSTERARELRREMTPSEQRLWRLLRDRRMTGFKFRRQTPFEGFILGFYCAAARLVVELDGESHLGREQRDHERQRKLEEHGLKVLRFWDTELFENPDGVLELIWRECTERARGNDEKEQS